jgi:hypothetical protein
VRSCGRVVRWGDGTMRPAGSLGGVSGHRSFDAATHRGSLRLICTSRALRRTESPDSALAIGGLVYQEFSIVRVNGIGIDSAPSRRATKDHLSAERALLQGLP